MKKAIIIIVLLLILGGGGYWYFTHKLAPQSKVVSTVLPKRPGVVGMHVEDDPSLFGWMVRGKSVVCNLTSTTTAGTMIIYTKKNIVRMEGIPYAFDTAAGNLNGVSLTDGDWVYMWSGKQGTKINIKTMQTTMTAEQKAKATEYSWQDSAKKWEGTYDYQCAEKTLADSLFVPPADITFNDLTDTLVNAQQAANELKKNMPSGNINQEDIEAQIEKINNTSTNK